ncbi:MAG: CHAT domain-containing protein [Bacteroidota bacterium]
MLSCWRSENFINKSVRLYQENRVLFDSAYADQLHYIPISAFTSYLRLYRSSGEEKKLLETAGKLERYVKGKQLDAGTAFQVSQAYTNLGHFYFGKRDHRTSLRYFKKARPALVPGSHPNYEVYYDMNVAKASMELGRNDKAFAIVDDVIVNERTTNTQLLGFMHAMRAILHARAKRKEEAFSDTQQMMEFFHQGDDPIDVRTAETVDGFRPSKRLNDAKLMRNHANDLALSFPLDMDMVVLTNNLCKMALRQFENCYSKNVYNPTLESLFRTLVRSVMTTNFYRYGHCDSDGTYVSKINNFEARFLWHNFLLNQQQEGVQRSDSLFAQRQRWQQELTVLEQQRQAAGADSSELAASIFDLSLQLERLGETLESEHRAYAHFSDYKFELSQFQRKLRPDQLILQYQLMMGQLFVFIIDRESISIHNLCDFPIIEPEVKTFVQALRQPQTDLDSLQSQAALLYEILRMEATEDYEDIIIVPDRILHYLPFGLLRHDGQYLLEEKHIHYATSLPILDFDWAARSSAAKGPGTFFAPSYEEFLLDDQQLVVRGSAYDLEGAQAEVGALSALTKGRAFVGREASKANFLQQAPGSRILHLSMHSYLNDEKPELSSMVFSDHESDHELFISELYGLRLGAELAVLSACNTGVGNLRKGEGVVSMSRAFTYAGVPATVSSLWSAPDQATKSIMLSFYENMQSGLSVGPALRQAKLQYLETVEDERFQHPYYWAGFVLHGQDRFLSFGSRNYSALLNWILGTLLVLGTWYVFGRSRRPRES